MKLIEGDVLAISTNVVKTDVEVFLGVEHQNIHTLQKVRGVLGDLTY